MVYVARCLGGGDGVTGCCASRPRVRFRLGRPLVGHIISLGREGCTRGSRFRSTPIGCRSTVRGCGQLLSVANSMTTGVVRPGSRSISLRNPRLRGNHVVCTDGAFRGLSTAHGTNL